MQEVNVGATEMVWLLSAACQLHRIPFDPKLVLGQHPPPHTVESLREALVSLGFRTGIEAVAAENLSILSGPCFATLTQPESEETHLALLLRCDGERVLFIEPSQAEPNEVALAEFGSRYTGKVLRFAPETVSAQDPDASPTAAEFGFKWFVPELLKHKNIWRDILLASLAIQLVGLATPLFTQVVIDKVVVHQTMSTLAVIGIGLFVLTK